MDQTGKERIGSFDLVPFFVNQSRFQSSLTHWLDPDLGVEAVR